jgi:hypothetical protein
VGKKKGKQQDEGLRRGTRGLDLLDLPCLLFVSGEFVIPDSSGKWWYDLEISLTRS